MGRQLVAVSWSTALLAAANILLALSSYIFATGFFPHKPFLPGLARYHARDWDGGVPPAPPFDRLVFMVVDALRSDFIYVNGSGFEFTQQLIGNGAGIPFTAHAASPTVTMPRIKAMTTGSIPSFLDVILNLDESDTSSTLASQDTWLAQMKAKQTGKLLMYGDDTWLKLFPDTFDRADGTSSFFVSDFTIVDDNVTRHVPDALRQDDWNTMVLHYLGLDHIGHKAGPRSAHMIPKQREMDAIVEQIYGAIETLPHLRSTLLVLCGDHGMNDAGNHGASSAGETSPALVFISPRMKAISKPETVPSSYVEDFKYYSLVQQSDLAPTLGALLGFPVPKNNLGILISHFLPFWPRKTDQRNLLLQNARQILDIVMAAFGPSILTHEFHSMDCTQLHSNVAERLACEWKQINGTAEQHKAGIDADLAWDAKISKWLRDAQGLMSSMASTYNVPRLIQGQVVAMLAAVMTVGLASTWPDWTVGDRIPFALITLGYGVMVFASSYVEEEHHFWYWSTTAWLLYLALKRSYVQAPSGAATVASLVTMRLVRSWNQTGQKFAGEPDMVKLFMVPYPELLWCLVLAAYGMVAVDLLRCLSRGQVTAGLPFIVTLVATAASFKLAFTNEDAPELVVGFARSLLGFFGGPSLASRAQAVFIGIGLGSIYPLYLLTIPRSSASSCRPMKMLHSLYTLLALTQSRATNAPLFLLFRIQYSLLEYISDLTTVEISISSLLLQTTSFFALGGSNAISSVDLSSAYNGVSGYNLVAVGMLTFVSNWAGPIWWTSATSLLLTRVTEAGQRQVYKQHVILLAAFISCSTLAVMAACTALRTHLFIWTVFSPKYLYSMAWTLGHHLLINIGFGGLLFWLGSPPNR